MKQINTGKGRRKKKCIRGPLPPSRLADCCWKPLGKTLVLAVPIIQASEREPNRLNQSGFYVFSFDLKIVYLDGIKKCGVKDKRGKKKRKSST